MWKLIFWIIVLYVCYRWALKIDRAGKNNTQEKPVSDEAPQKNRVGLVVEIARDGKNRPQEKPASDEDSQKSRVEQVIAIARAGNTEAVIDMPVEGTNLSPEVIAKIKEKVAQSAAKGENLQHCRAVDEIPDDFEWQVFDEWVEKFKAKGEWPSGWENTAEYCAFINADYPGKGYDGYDWAGHLQTCDKKTLLELVEKYDIGRIKSNPKRDIIAALVEKLPETAWADIYQMELKELQDNVKAEKKYLLQDALMSKSIEQEKIREAREGGETHIKLYVASDACSFCRAMDQVYNLDEAPVIGKELHPGCMCTFGPALD